MTAEEFFALGEDVMGELVDGVFVPVTPAGGPHGSIDMRLAAALGAFVYPRELGELFSEQTGFVLRRRPDVVRCPDVAFVAAARLPGGVRLVWIVDPDARTIAVHAPDASSRWLTSADTLDGGDVLAGFTTPVASLFAGLAALDPRPTD